MSISENIIACLSYTFFNYYISVSAPSGYFPDTYNLLTVLPVIIIISISLLAILRNDFLGVFLGEKRAEMGKRLRPGI